MNLIICFYILSLKLYYIYYEINVLYFPSSKLRIEIGHFLVDITSSKKGPNRSIISGNKYQ